MEPKTPVRGGSEIRRPLRTQESMPAQVSVSEEFQKELCRTIRKSGRGGEIVGLDISRFRAKSMPDPATSAREIQSKLDQLVEGLLFMGRAADLLFGYMEVVSSTALFRDLNQKFDQDESNLKRIAILKFALLWWSTPFFRSHRKDSEVAEQVASLFGKGNAAPVLQPYVEEWNSLQKEASKAGKGPLSPRSFLRSATESLKGVKDGTAKKKARKEFAEELTHDLTLYWGKRFVEIEPQEWLINLNKNRDLAPRLSAMIDSFNCHVRQLTELLLSVSSKEEFVRLFKFFARLGHSLVKRGNFFSLEALNVSLNSVIVSRLVKQCQKVIGKRALSDFEKIHVICSNGESFKKLRQMQEEALKQDGTCIPAFFFLRHDLAAITENNPLMLEGASPQLNWKRIELSGGMLKQINRFYGSLDKVLSDYPLTDYSRLFEGYSAKSDEEWKRFEDSRCEHILGCSRFSNAFSRSG